MKRRASDWGFVGTDIEAVVELEITSVFVCEIAVRFGIFLIYRYCRYYEAYLSKTMKNDSMCKAVSSGNVLDEALV